MVEWATLISINLIAENMYRVFFHNPCDYIIRKPLTYYMFPLREIIKNKRILESHRSTIDRLCNVYKYSLYKGLVKCNRISPSKVDERHRPHANTTHRATQHQGGRHEVKSFIGCSCCRGWERWARRESFIGAQLLPWMRTLSATQPKLHRSLRFV